ncbi:four helix bundle protein [Candidatus Dojkabacteria bacterium]|nr:four helix bundle protein [Candidatus Dojkabacteria bacterium]
MYTYKDLIVWQKSMDLVIKVYELTKHYPNYELYNLTSHTRKTAVSIPSNIAEGRRRLTRKEFYRFLVIAYSSGAELETQIKIGKRLGYCKRKIIKNVDKLLNEIMRILNKMISKLKD